MTVLVAMLLAGIGTFVLRSSMIVLQERLGSIDWLERRLALVGPAVLGAIVTSWLVVDDTTASMPGAVEMAAVAGALLTVRRTGKVGLALGAGLPIYWVGAVVGLA